MLLLKLPLVVSCLQHVWASSIKSEVCTCTNAGLGFVGLIVSEEGAAEALAVICHLLVMPLISCQYPAWHTPSSGGALVAWTAHR